MQLTSPIKQAESRYINLPQYSNYSNQPQSMKSPNSVISVNNSSQQVFKSESKSQNMVQSQTSGPYIEFDSTDPIQVQCDNCHTFSSSLVYIENTKYTYIFAVLFILICLCWVPFVLKKFFMKISHVCPGCDRVVGQYDYMANKFKGLF